MQTTPGLNSVTLPSACELVLEFKLSESVVITVPCYNEADRLDVDQFLRALREDETLRLVFVNDGSRDTTLEILYRIRQKARDSVEVLDLQPNKGKAEAVRVGLQRAMSLGVSTVGFWDADLATPFSELAYFRRILNEHQHLDVVLGSRVRLLGRQIARSPFRHYAGRVFATGASLTLGLPVYDTQCGAKLFRVTAALEKSLAIPFTSGWIFDVELLARYMQFLPGGREEMLTRAYELPLVHWTDVAGSKVRLQDFLRSGFELVRLWHRYSP